MNSVGHMLNYFPATPKSTKLRKTPNRSKDLVDRWGECLGSIRNMRFFVLVDPQAAAVGVFGNLLAKINRKNKPES